MTLKTFFRAALMLLTVPMVIVLTPTMVWAYGNLQESYQEVSYDDLINELNAKQVSGMKMNAMKQRAPLTQVRLGVGFVQSFTQLNVKNENTERSQSGIQLAAAMNLDVPNMYAETIFRNFSGSTLAKEELQIQQLDARVGLVQELTAPWKYTLMTGLSGRLIQASNTLRDYSVNEITPSFTAGFGAMAEIHKNIHLGIEVAGRTSLFGRTAEKNSADLSVRLDTAL
jgi:hypothetical protein